MHATNHNHLLFFLIFLRLFLLVFLPVWTGRPIRDSFIVINKWLIQVNNKTHPSRFFFFFFFLPSSSSFRSLDGDGVRTRAYFLFFSRSAFLCACSSSCSAVPLANVSLAFRSGSKLEPSTKYSDIPNASRSFAFFSCCASAI